MDFFETKLNEPWHEISNNLVCATSKGSDQPAHTSDQSLCWLLEYFMIVKLLIEHHLELRSLTGGCKGSSESTLVKMPHCWKISCTGSNLYTYLSAFRPGYGCQSTLLRIIQDWKQALDGPRRAKTCLRGFR